MHWLTGAEHIVHGLVTEDPAVREQQMEKRARKLEWAAREIPLEEKLEVYGHPEASFTIVGWGSNKGAILTGSAGTPGIGGHPRPSDPGPPLVALPDRGDCPASKRGGSPGRCGVELLRPDGTSVVRTDGANVPSSGGQVQRSSHFLSGALCGPPRHLRWKGRATDRSAQSI